LLLLLRDARFEIANCDLKEHPDFVKLCQKRFYDFNGWSKHKRIENLHIRNLTPVMAGTGAGAGSVDLERLPCVC
jgi:hypothetical protein